MKDFYKKFYKKSNILCSFYLFILCFLRMKRHRRLGRRQNRVKPTLFEGIDKKKTAYYEVKDSLKTY